LGDYPGLSRWTQGNYKGSDRTEATGTEREKATDMTTKAEEERAVAGVEA
jgi:hypothetical protein